MKYQVTFIFHATYALAKRWSYHSAVDHGTEKFPYAFMGKKEEKNRQDINQMVIKTGLTSFRLVFNSENRK